MTDVCVCRQWFHMRYKQGHAYGKDVYSNESEYFADVAKAYSRELEVLYEAGLRNVQFDDPGLACQSSPPPTPSPLAPHLPCPNP